MHQIFLMVSRDVILWGYFFLEKWYPPLPPVTVINGYTIRARFPLQYYNSVSTEIIALLAAADVIKWYLRQLLLRCC